MHKIFYSLLHMINHLSMSSSSKKVDFEKKYVFYPVTLSFMLSSFSGKCAPNESTEELSSLVIPTIKSRGQNNFDAPLLASRLEFWMINTKRSIIHHKFFE